MCISFDAGHPSVQKAKTVQSRWSAETDLLIMPGHTFRWADGLLTNFHLARSTLLALVAAFTGIDRLRDLYDEAVQEGYRFHSYGDAMLLLPGDHA